MILAQTIMVGSARSYESIDALMQALRDPFPARDVEWRVQTSGKTTKGPWVRVIAYIDNRAIMERLDAVAGVDGWRNEFKHAGTGAVLCGLSLYIAGDWITKWDGASETDIEPAKGGLSGAQKRAAVEWGIGRYLYNIEENFAEIVSLANKEAHYLKANKDKHGAELRWLPPTLAPWALPGGSGDPGAVGKPLRERGDAAEKTLRVDASRDVLIPGTAAHFGGYGGKRIRDVPPDALPAIVKFLREKGTYGDVCDAIDLTLDAHTQGGG
jgi:hypothetical protein